MDVTLTHNVARRQSPSCCTCERAGRRFPYVMETLVPPDNGSWKKAEDTGGRTDVASCERSWKWGCARNPEAVFKLGMAATQGLAQAVGKE